MSGENRQPFSRRQGFTTTQREITIREDAPEQLREAIIDFGSSAGLSASQLRDIICRILHLRPDLNNWSSGNVYSEVQDLVHNCDWFRVYDFAESIYASLVNRGDEFQAGEFERSLNDFFGESGIGWQMANGEIVLRGSEEFEVLVKESHRVLGEEGKSTARNEIHEALSDLSRRPTPDITGAVQHAMAALECVAKDISGESTLTLGNILKNPDNLSLPKPLDSAIDKLWGYASEMGRHLREGREPSYEEAELIVGIAATVSTYLVKKNKTRIESEESHSPDVPF
jgi:hypothetical protein